MSLTPGENIGPYRIVEQLGSGGMATVYKAYHAALDRYVAIKVMHPAFKGDAGFLARFQREARVVANLDHPNIVPVHDISEHEGSPYLVMRFVEGHTLKAHLSHGQLTLPEILDLIRPIGEALHYAHENGVLHRDVKPSNVLLTDDGRVYLTDFGLARIVQAGESSLTRDALVGTPYYISPEQAIGRGELDARTDIYSFGVVLYELLTGRVPFQSDTPFAVIHDHIYTPLPLPTTVNPNLPPALERVLLRALAKDPSDRFATAIEMVAAVEETVTDQAVVPPVRPASEAAAPAPTVSDTRVQPVSERAAVVPPQPTSRRRGQRSWLFILGGITLLALVAVGAILLSRRGADEKGQPVQVPAQVLDQSPQDEPPVERLPSLPDLPPEIQRAVDMAAQGDAEGALQMFERTIEQDPDLAPLYADVARQFFQRGEFPAGIVLLQMAVRAQPGDPGLHLDLAQALIAIDRWDEAMADIDWLLEHAPELPEPHAYFSVHLVINVDDMDGAQHHADEALRLNPESPETHFAMGVLHWARRDFGRARFELERARRLSRDSPLLRQRIESFLERLD